MKEKLNKATLIEVHFEQRQTCQTREKPEFSIALVVLKPKSIFEVSVVLKTVFFSSPSSKRIQLSKLKNQFLENLPKMFAKFPTMVAREGKS